MAQPAIATLLQEQTGAFRPFVQYPGDKCCYLFDDINYDNWGNRNQNTNIDDFRKLICHDGTRTTIDLWAEGWGNKVSSYMCGKNVWYDFCRYGTDDCVGGHRTNSGAGYLRNYAIGHMNNAQGNVILGPYDPSELGAVTLFEGEECSGASGRFYWDPDTDESGTYYNNMDLYYGGMRDNTMSSFTVPKGYTVELYTDNGFSGLSQIVEGAYKSDRSEELQCFRAKYPDGVSSLIVRRQEQGAAVGYWQAVTSTQSQEVEYHTGITYDNHSHSKWDEAETMNIALDLGLTFLSEYLWEPLSLIPRVRDVVKREVTSVYAYEYSMRQTTSCTVPENSTGGASLWQWVVSTQDGRTNVFSHYTVCRTGELWKSEPVCPPFACLNADCSECEADWNV